MSIGNSGTPRTVTTWGPSPIPPWVIDMRVPVNKRVRIHRILLEMESYAEGKSVLLGLGMKRFARVGDADYEPIWEMARMAR